MKLHPKHTPIPIHTGIIILFIMLLFAVSSCSAHPSYVGKKVTPKQVLTFISADEEESIWQTKDMEVTYRTVKNGGSFTVEGMLSVNDSITRTFPAVTWLNFYIHYLDEDNKVISTHPVRINTGYRNKVAKNLKFVNVPNAPPEAVSFAFSYWGELTGFGVSDENPGEWEIYFDPFKENKKEQKTEGNGLFYAD